MYAPSLTLLDPLTFFVFFNLIFAKLQLFWFKTDLVRLYILGWILFYDFFFPSSLSCAFKTKKSRHTVPLAFFVVSLTPIQNAFSQYHCVLGFLHLFIFPFPGLYYILYSLMFLKYICVSSDPRPSSLFTNDYTKVNLLESMFFSDNTPKIPKCAQESVTSYPGLLYLSTSSTRL